MSWNRDSAEEFYIDMGGSYSDNITTTGDEFSLVDAGMRLKNMARNKGAAPSRTSDKAVQSSSSNDNLVSYFLETTWKNRIVMVALFMLV